jgi:hypothetical protein
MKARKGRRFDESRLHSRVAAAISDNPVRRSETGFAVPRRQVEGAFTARLQVRIRSGDPDIQATNLSGRER